MNRYYYYYIMHTYCFLFSEIGAARREYLLANLFAFLNNHHEDSYRRY